MENVKQAVEDKVSKEIENFSDSVKAQNKELVKETETADQFAELKQDINASFEELVAVILEDRRTIDDILSRMELFNRRSGQKL